MHPRNSLSAVRGFLLSLGLLAACAAIFASPAAAAKSSIRVGIGDQNPSMFSHPKYQELDMKMSRYFFPWNGMKDDYQVTRATQYLAAAKASGVSVLFHISTDNFALKKAKLPTVKAYTAELKKIVPYFRALGVKEWGVWNEANHASQPTYKNPKRAAEFFRAMYQVVGSKDKIVALDVLDQGGVDTYQRRFYAALSKTYRKRAKIVGIHNYGDVNRNRTTYTSKMISTSRKYNRSTKFWFTETGALVEFGKSFKCSTSRAGKRMKNVFNLAKRYKRSGVERILLYNWNGPGCGKARFDAGLVTPDGTPRANYYALAKLLKNYSR